VPIEPMGRSGEAELVQRVFLLPAEDVPRVVTFCGVGQADGAGGICARAGLLLADQTGSSVCVVEGDFHSPSLHKYLDVENYRGLTDALFESGPIRELNEFSNRPGFENSFNALRKLTSLCSQAALVPGSCKLRGIPSGCAPALQNSAESFPTFWSTARRRLNT